MRAALQAAGLRSADQAQIEHAARGVYRVDAASRLLACKLFDGPQAGERARTESAAYAALAERGAPVPRLVSADEASAAIVRDWVAGPTLAQALRGEAVRPTWEQVTAAWNALLTALDAWTEALESGRVERSRTLRQSELAAVAESVIASGLLRNEEPASGAAAEEIRQLPRVVGDASVRTVPLDLNPGNVVLGADGITFVDLEAFGLDFPDWSLSKATMLPHDPTSGRPGQALVAGEVNAPRPRDNSRTLASALLLALADAAGLWRSGPFHPAGLALVRQLCCGAPNVEHLAPTLV